MESDIIAEVLTYDLVRREQGIKDDLIGLDINSQITFRDEPIPFEVLNRYGVEAAMYNNIYNTFEPVNFSFRDVRNRFLDMDSSLAQFPFSNCVIAGGSVTNNILKIEDETDLDFFFYGISPSRMYEQIDRMSYIILNNNNEKVRFTRTPHVYTIQIMRRTETKTFQFVLRSYSTMSEILHAFDIPAGAVCYDGKAIYMTTMCYFTLKHNLIIADTTRRSTTYEQRLTKYSLHKDFFTLFPFGENRGDPPEILSRAEEDHLKLRSIMGQEYTTMTGMHIISIVKDQIERPSDLFGRISTPSLFTLVKLLTGTQLVIKVRGVQRERSHLWKNAPSMLSQYLGLDWVKKIAEVYALRFLYYMSGLTYVYNVAYKGTNLDVEICNLRKLMNMCNMDVNLAVGELMKDTIDPRVLMTRQEIINIPSVQDIDVSRMNNARLLYTLYPKRIKKIIPHNNTRIRFYKAILTAFINPTMKETHILITVTELLKVMIPRLIKAGERTWGVITKNPTTQITASYNPIIRHPREWYDSLAGNYTYRTHLKLVMYLSIRDEEISTLKKISIKRILRSVPLEELHDSPVYNDILRSITDDGSDLIIDLPTE